MSLSRATVKQKKFIDYINRKLGMSEEESFRVVKSINSFEDADRYIKKYLPIVKIKALSFKEIRFLYYKLLVDLEKIFKT